MERGGQPGNDNSGRGYRYRKALERALAHKYGSVDDGLFAIARKRVGKADDGDADSLRAIEERFDGKPIQAVDAHISGSLTSVIEQARTVTPPDAGGGKD